MDSSRDTELRYSAVEQYIRSLPYQPDAWDFNGETLTVVSGGDITTIPYENTQTVMAAEDVGGLGGRDLTPENEDNEDFRYFSQADEKRDPLEERKDQQFFLSVSLVPKDYFVTDMEQVQQDVQEFLSTSTRAGWQLDEHLIIAVDTDNNEIDILIHSFGDRIPYDRMVQLHDLFSEVFNIIDVSGYVYADFVEPLIETNYPLTYGYPAARQAMMARAWESESFAAEGDEYVCCVCGRTRIMAEGSDFPYWAHEVECAKSVHDCDCDLMICSARCDKEGLAKGDFHYPLESESFAAENPTQWIELNPVMVAKWLSTPNPSNPTETPPDWSAQEARLLLRTMQEIEDGEEIGGFKIPQDLLAIAARDGPQTILDLWPDTRLDSETVVFEARPTTFQRIREKYVEIWEGHDYSEQDEDDEDYGLPRQISHVLEGIKNEPKINEQALEWICNQFAATNPETDELWNPNLIWPEDLPRALEVWDWYSEAKKDPRIQNKFRELFPGRPPKNPLEYSVEDMEDVMDAVTPEAVKAAKNNRWNPQELGYDPKVAKEILNEDGLMIVEITGEAGGDAASKYASGTRWCTSSPATAKNYLRQGPLYVVFQNGQKFAQIHAESNQVCDIRDRNMSELPGPLSKFMFEKSKKNYDQDIMLIKNPDQARAHLIEGKIQDLQERMRKESATLKSLQTRFGDPEDDDEITPIRELIIGPYVDRNRISRVKSEKEVIQSALDGDHDDLISEHELDNWIENQERTLGQTIQSLTRFREMSEGDKPDDPELREMMYKIIDRQEAGDVDYPYDRSRYRGDGVNFGHAYEYLLADGKRDPRMEKVLLTAKSNEETALNTTINYYHSLLGRENEDPLKSIPSEWMADRWPELEAHLNPRTTSSAWVKKQAKAHNKGVSTEWADKIGEYLKGNYHNQGIDIWRWPEGLLLLIGNDKDPTNPKVRKAELKDLLNAARTRYQNGHQEQMPESLAKKVIPKLRVQEVLEYSEIFPEDLIKNVQLPVIEKTNTIQDVAQELIEITYGRGGTHWGTGYRHNAIHSNLDAWPEGEERILDYIVSGGELSPEITSAFELVIEPKLDNKTKEIRESNVKGGMKPPAVKGYPCDSCLQNLSWRKAKKRSKKKEWLDSKGKSKCTVVHGYGRGNVNKNHELMIPSTMLMCTKCEGWRPVAKIRKEKMSWQENRFIQNAGYDWGGGNKKCKCTFRKDNIRLYEAEDIYSSEGRRNKCGNCGELGHTRRTCTNESVVEPTDPRKIDDFESTVPKESKMARGARVKRNIRRLLSHLGPLSRSSLAGAYQAQSGAKVMPRQDMGLLTRMANADPEIIEWRSQYYLLGPGGKQEFFRTGPGSLGLSEKKSAEERPYTLFLQVEPFGSFNLDIRNKITEAAEGQGFEWIESTGSRALFEDGDLELLREIADEVAGDMGQTALVLRIKDPGLGLTFIEELETLQRSAEGSAPAPFGEIDAAMADAMARTHQRIAEIGKAMDEILQKHGGSYEAAEVDQEYLKLASEYAHLSRALLRIQNVMRD